jgi:hypothetical protein
MPTTLRIKAKVKAGHRLEIVSPELPEGDMVEVTVVLPEKSAVPSPRKVLDYLNSLPDVPRSFATPQEVNEYLRKERDQWH